MKKIKIPYARPSDIILMLVFGSFSLTVTEGSERALTLMIAKGFRFSYVKSEDGALSFRAFLFRKKEICESFTRIGVNFSVGEDHGLPALFLSLSKRYGLMLGLLTLLLMTFFSQRFIWQIKVVPDGSTSVSETLRVLDSLGLKKGAFIPSLDIDGICTDFLIECDGISWIRINAIGNCVEVVLKDKSTRPAPEAEQPSNIVADCDGLIYRVELSGGQRLVFGGESVLKGQVLISGLVQNEKDGIAEAPVEDPTYHFERSIAKVFALTKETIEVKIPLKTVKKEYTGEKHEKKSFIFFSKSINFSFMGRNLPTSCDIIRMYDEIELPGEKILPVAIERELCLPYIEKEITLTEAEAERLARGELAERLSSLLGDEGILLCERTESETDGEFYTLTCSIECIRDIAVETPLFASDVNLK